MKSWILIIFCFWQIFHAVSQDKSYEDRIKELKIKSNYARFGEHKKAILYLKEGLHLSNSQKNEIDIGYFYRKLISEFGIARQLDSSIYYYQKASNYSQNLSNKIGSKKRKEPQLDAHLASELAEAYHTNFDFEQSKKFYLLAQKKYAEFHDYIGIGIIDINLGNLESNQGNFHKAIDFYFRSVKTFDTTEYHYILGEVYYSIGYVYQQMNQFNHAIKYGEKSLFEFQQGDYELPKVVTAQIFLAELYFQNNQTNKARNELKRAKLHIENNQLNYLLPYFTIVHSKLKQAEKQLIQAEKEFQHAQKYVQESQVTPLIGIQFNLAYANILSQLKQKEKAKKLLEKILPVIDSLHLYVIGLDVTKELMSIYEENGDYFAALNQLKKHQHYYHESIGLKKQRAFKEIETKYQAAESKSKILEQQNELKEKEWIINRNFYITSVVILISSLLFLLLFMYFRSIKHKKENEIRRLALQSKEEKLRISRDLHDNIGSELTLIQSKINQRLFVSTNETEREYMHELSSYSKQAIEELRKTIWATKADAILISELESKIEQFVSRFPIEYSFHSDYHDQALRSIVGLSLFRMVQESIQNAVKHSESTSIEIKMMMRNNHLEIQIIDFGKGFDVKLIPSGYGIENMHERVNEINGNYNIISSENGTIISLSVPI